MAQRKCFRHLGSSFRPLAIGEIADSRIGAPAESGPEQSSILSGAKRNEKGRSGDGEEIARMASGSGELIGPLSNKYALPPPNGFGGPLASLAR